MNPDEHELEQFLDRALNEYSEVSARDGLEQRILANLTANPAEPRNRWGWVLIPAAAVLIVVAVLWLQTEKKAPTPPVAKTAIPSAPSIATNRTQPFVAVKRGRSHRPLPRAAGLVKTTPRLATFPSQPDESQARMLLQFVQGSPKAAQQVVKEEEEFQKLVAENFKDSKTEQGLEMR